MAYPLRIGTRGSRLALAQAHWVADQLRSRGSDVEIIEITTSGDRIRDVPLGPHLGSSFFTKEIESALLDGAIDLAVHSCKDLASRMPDGLTLGAVPVREDTRDVVVARAGADLESALRVGTSSPRRRGALAALRPSWDVIDQRGNVPTRVAAADDGTVDAVILAAAGLRRLGLADRITHHFPPDELVPAAGQGALALQARSEDASTDSVIRALEDPDARPCVDAERAVLRSLDAGCQAPVGAWARMTSEGIELFGMLAGDGQVVRAHAVGDPAAAEEIGARVASDLLDAAGISSVNEVTG
ncbi:MAG: hydroxymethylbilane synthase [Gemmatimonadota bacterium]